MRLAESWRTLSPAARLLVVNQLGVNLGFYMVVPFLATYLRDDLGFAAAVVGVVLGLRVLSQQGLFLVGGVASDRWGSRPVIIVGCAMRVLAFGLLATTTNLVGVVLAVVTIGLAGAVFNPAVRAFLIRESPGRRAETFAVFESAGNVGSLAGPVVGAALLAVDFRVVSAVACGVFAALTLAQVRLLPARTVDRSTVVETSSWRDVLRNRPFWVLALAGACYFAMFNQLYLALPLELERITGRPETVGAVFVVFGATSILAPVPVVAWCRRRWSAARSMGTGLVLMATSFTVLAVAAPLLRTAAAPVGVREGLGVAVVLVPAVALLALGVVVVTPFAMELIPLVGSEERVGTYYGSYYLVSAVAAAVVSWLSGTLFDLSGQLARSAPFVLLAAIGLLGALGTVRLSRRA